MQSNHEGILIDAIHDARLDCRGIVINPGGFSHTSVALADALAAVALPVAEVHLTNIHRREAFRHHSYVSAVAEMVVAGAGLLGYEVAVRILTPATNATSERRNPLTRRPSAAHGRPTSSGVSAAGRDLRKSASSVVTATHRASLPAWHAVDGEDGHSGTRHTHTQRAQVGHRVPTSAPRWVDAADLFLDAGGHDLHVLQSSRDALPPWRRHAAITDGGDAYRSQQSGGIAVAPRPRLEWRVVSVDGEEAATCRLHAE